MTEIKIEQPNIEERKQFDQFRLDHKDDKIGPIATNVLFEDERVKVWDMTLAPGENCDLHTHENDYYLVMLQGDQVCRHLAGWHERPRIQSHSWRPHLPHPEGRNGVGGQHRKGALLRDPGRDQEVAVRARGDRMTNSNNGRTTWT